MAQRPALQPIKALRPHALGRATHSAGGGHTSLAKTDRSAAPVPGLAVFAGSLPVDGFADGPGAQARFFSPSGVTVAEDGTLYLVDAGNHTIRKITRTGVVSTWAGKAATPGSADGVGGEARFNRPNCAALDGTGNLYVSDSNNNTIRMITPAGVVSTLAGMAGTAGSADGAGLAARFRSPNGLAVDAAGTLYLADSNNNTIRKLANGEVTTLAGTAGVCGCADGQGGAASFNNPCGIALDGHGNLYVADCGNSLIRKVDPSGTVTTLAGNVTQEGSADGVGSAALFEQPFGVAVDLAGKLYVSDANNCLIRKVTPEGGVTTLAGAAGIAGSADGPIAQARFNMPFGVAVDRAGNLFVVDNGTNTLRKLTRQGRVRTVAGKARGIGSADGKGAAATFSAPDLVARDGSGNLYVTDHGNFVVRKITSAGVVSTLAGRAGVPGSADGASADARFRSLHGVAVDGAGTVYVVDTGNSTIRKITAQGLVSTLAGLAGASGSADGQGTDARFNDPFAVVVGPSGLLYVSEGDGNRIRTITPEGVVKTWAGQAGTAGSADGSVDTATFNCPLGLALDPAGNLLVADGNNNTIRKITPAGVVSTLAGTAGTLGSADGTGAAARFNYPYALAMDGAGILYLSDGLNCTIRSLTASGQVTTVVGTPGLYTTVPGPLPASLASPGGIAVDPATATLYIVAGNAILTATF